MDRAFLKNNILDRCHFHYPHKKFPEQLPSSCSYVALFLTNKIFLRKTTVTLSCLTSTLLHSLLGKPGDCSAATGGINCCSYSSSL